eukprot:GHVL01013085.1.p1 GENE.GHVL01013085.1~~GHVL01013085.1.p1  ORF type:complete len:695 (+),score=146.34 GHVL01013085.1:45-2087(+)
MLSLFLIVCAALAIRLPELEKVVSSKALQKSNEKSVDEIAAQQKLIPNQLPAFNATSTVDLSTDNNSTSKPLEQSDSNNEINSKADDGVETSPGEAIIKKTAPPKTMEGILSGFQRLLEDRAANGQRRREVTETKLNNILKSQGADEKLKEVVRQIIREVSSEHKNEKEGQDEVDFMLENLKSVSSRLSVVEGCEDLVCSQYGTCEIGPQGAGQCICQPGYVGDGESCLPARMFTAQPLVPGVSKQPLVNEMFSTPMGTSNIITVFRDKSQNGIGKIMIGIIGDNNSISWSAPEEFSDGDPAYSPAVTAHPSGHFAISWRNADTNGLLWLKSGYLDLKVAAAKIIWAESAIMVARMQSRASSLLSLSNQRIALMYQNHHLSTPGQPAQAYGAASLYEIEDKGGLSCLGDYEFADKEVSRITATLLQNDEFVVAFREGRETDTAAGANHMTEDSTHDMKTDDMKSIKNKLKGKNDKISGRAEKIKETNEIDTVEGNDMVLGELTSDRSEANAVVARMVGDDLIFVPHPLKIEPHLKDIWARDVSVVGKDRIIYAYYAGNVDETRAAMIDLDPVHHRLHVTDGPIVLKKGRTPFVHTVSVLGDESQAIIIYQTMKDSHPTVEMSICPINSLGKMDTCEEHSWADRGVSSVSAMSLDPKTILFVFSDEQGIPWYQLAGFHRNK